MLQSALLIPLLSSFIFTSLITPLVIIAMKSTKILDDPKRHKHPGIIHHIPVPRGGGIALFLGVFIAAFIFLPHSLTTVGIFTAAFIALVVGVYDDYLNSVGKDLSPYLRFGMNILCGLIVVLSGVSINFITNPFGGIINLNHFSLNILSFSIYLSDLIALIWIVWIMNMLNWSKGVDGQMPGIVGISAVTIGILSLRAGGAEYAFLDAVLSFIIAGAAFGFLLYNFYPAKIFPGYGATSIYLLLAVVSILSGAKLATAILVMGVPIVDAGFTIIRRIASGKSPFLHDNLHLHHILLRLGLSQRQIALCYWIFSAILGSISLTLESRSKLFAIIMVVSITGGALLFLHYLMRNSNEEKAI